MAAEETGDKESSAAPTRGCSSLNEVLIKNDGEAAQGQLSGFAHPLIRFLDPRASCTLIPVGHSLLIYM